MAGAGYKLFNTGDVLLASEVNTYLMQQTVMVFANATARTSALSGVLAEGMVSYLQDTNVVEIYNGSAWASLDDPNAIQNTIVDAKGDLISATADNTPARLASSGNNGDVLTIDTSTSTGLKWAAASGGGMTVIASGTLSGASVTISSISGAYKDLRLVIKNWKPATDNAILYGQLNADTGTNYYTTVGMDTNRSNQTFNSDFIYLASFNDNSVAQGLSQSTFYEYANTTTWKMYEGICINNHHTTTTNFNALYQNGFYNSTSAITEIKIYPSTGNHTSGDYILYGIN